MGELAKKLPEMKEKLEENDIVILSRYVDGGKDLRSPQRILSSKIINYLCQLMLSNKIKDYTSGVFLMKREVLLSVVPISTGHGEFFIEFLYTAINKDYQIKEIPYNQRKDDDDNTNTSPNLLRFFILGFFYFLRVLFCRFRRN